jgi:hypothetical protein
LLNGIAQALENEDAANLVFGALMLQVPNLQQQVRRQHGGSLPSCSPNELKSAKLATTELCEIILHNI